MGSVMVKLNSHMRMMVINSSITKISYALREDGTRRFVFTGSNFPRNDCGYNLNLGRVHTLVAREMKRRPTSNALNIKSKESLNIVVKRVSKLLDNNQSHTELVMESLNKMIINSNNDLYIALNNTKDSPQREESFLKQFKDVSEGCNLSHKIGSFLKCVPMYMDGRGSMIMNISNK